MSDTKPSDSKVSSSEASNLQAPRSTTIQVVFLLDITGSMGSQIEGMKAMISTFCSFERPGVDIHIWTFDENTNSCYISKSKPGLADFELVDYTDNIKLSQPPDYPGCTGGGGDGPENVVACVTSLLHSFDTSSNIVAFIITDDAPHHASFGLSGEARAEKKWLLEHGHADQDVFLLLNEVIESLNVTFVPVLFGGAYTYKWYQQAAALTGGVVLRPNSTDSEVLAFGLGALLVSFQKLAASGGEFNREGSDFTEVFKGYSVAKIDTDNFEPLDKDPANRNEVTSNVDLLNTAEEITASILGLIETACDRFKGKKVGKRCRGVDPLVIASSVRVLTMSMLDLIGSPLFDGESLNAGVASLIKSLEDSKSDNSAYEIKQVNRWIESLASNKALLQDSLAAPDAVIQPVQCVVALETAAQFLSSLQQVPSSEEEVSAWMEIVLNLTMCRLVNITFPLDAAGKTDFMDAWSASIRHVELSSPLTTFAAARLRDPTTLMYLDPVSRRNNSAAVLLAHPNDQVLTMIYAGLSALPSLQGLVQTYIVSGGLKLFPAILPGIQASILLYFLRGLGTDKVFTQAEWEYVRCIVWSLQKTVDIPAASVFNSIKNGNGLNPADNLSKVLVGVLGYSHRLKTVEAAGESVLRLLYQELSADQVGFLYSRRQREAQNKAEGKVQAEEAKVEAKSDGIPTDSEITQCFVRSDNLEAFEPCADLHEAEKIVRKITPLPQEGRHKMQALAQECEAFKRTTNLFHTFCRLLQCDPRVQDVQEALYSSPIDSSSGLSQAELAEIFTESLILKKRTARYILDEEKKWRRPSPESPPVNLDETIVENIRESYRTKFSEWTAARKTFSYNTLVTAASQVEGETTEACNKALTGFCFELLGTKYELNRIDSIDVLKQIADDKLNTLGLALILGSWTPQPTSSLRRYCTDLCTRYSAYPETVQRINEEVLKAETCTRTSSNRHGHTSENIFPGMAGWTQEYNDKRIADTKKKAKVEKALEVMKDFAKYVEGVREEGMGRNRRTLAEWIIGSVQNTKEVQRAKDMINMARERPQLDADDWSEKLELKIKEISKIGQRSKRKPHVRIVEFLKSLD